MSDALAKLKQRLDAQAKEYLLQSALMWQGDVTRRFGHGPITSRSGSLVKSLTYTPITGTGIGNYEIRLVSAGVPYARVQEYGGTIRAKRKFLTIPLSAMKTKSGVTRLPFRQWLDNAKRTGVVDWFKKGNGWVIAWRRKGAEKGELFWKLQPSVTLPGPANGKPSRLGFFDTWKALAPRREALARRLLGAHAIFGGRG